MQGWLNSNLTKQGITNARKLGEHLKHIDFDYVSCSPLGRAKETASHILGDKDTKIVYNEAFKEMGFGKWEGMLHEDVKEQYTEQQHNFWNAPHLFKTIDGESYELFIDRIRQGLEELIKSKACENILLVTHAAVIKAIFLIIEKRSLENFWAPPFTYDTCLSILEVENGEIRVLMEPDISHLE
ncbi:MAG: fructose-2,6-bisphosphatase [Clostridia bacterium]|jgi:probable phosphoglycerate mutase|nr:fructose-2,6-bisphosphatase [Clostridia bacterium]